MLESRTLHLVRPVNLNHHGTLFAGQIAMWLIEAGLITAARLVGRPEDIVCVKVNSLVFKKPINNGDLIEVRSKVAHLGKTSITVYGEVLRKPDTSPLVSDYITYVAVDSKNKPYRHGFILPEDYIAANREICKEAEILRNVV
jgi:acyl-CoA hydrolase